MAGSSDTGLVLSLQNEQVQFGQKKPEEKRFYALYFLKRISGTDDCASTESSSDAGESSSTCLSIAATNLAATAETDLRKTLSHKLLNKTRPCKEGHVFAIGLNSTESTSLSASCYCCIAKSSSDSLGFDHLLQDGLSGGESVDVDCQEFLVCFISFHESSLDLFRTELDQYSHGLMPLLDKEVPSTQQTELSQLSTTIQNYLEQWPSVVLGYITRTMHCMGPEIQHLIYAALLNANLQISGASVQLEQDIKKFYQCCSLSDLLEKPLTDQVPSSTGQSNNAEVWQLQPVVVSVDLTEGSATFGSIYSCQFCKNVADKLLAQDKSNVAKIREFLESIKLAFAHNLNKLKRFLGQAEVDFYALYRALSYLRKCGCGDLLLRYVKLDATPETVSVVSVLEQFTCQVPPSLT